MSTPAGWIVESATARQFTARAIETVLEFRRTDYQEMYIVRTADLGKALVLDGKWQSCVADEFIYHEALVHPAACLQRHPERVLIIGGAEGAAAREVVRWPTVNHVVMVDIDGDVVNACKRHLPEMHQQAFNDTRVTVLIMDGLAYVEQCTETWDLILLDLSDPLDAGPSLQLFTREFFGKVKQVLAQGGIMVTQAGPCGPTHADTFAKVVRTAAAVFDGVLPYTTCVPSFPDLWGFVLAAAAPLPSPESSSFASLEALGTSLSMLDASAAAAMFLLPLYLQRAIDRGSSISTTAEPMTFFGA